MKLFLFLLLHCFFITRLAAQNVGVNTTAPVENLQVDSCIKVGKNATLTGAKKNIIKFGDDAFVTIGEEVGDDKMYLRYGTLSLMRSDNSIGNGYMGIQTESPTATLDINGSVRIRGNGAAAGKTLTSDANGVASWSGPVAFSARRTGASLQVAGLSNNTTIFNSTEYETVPGLLTPSPNTFKAPVSGIYHFSGSVTVAGSGAANGWRVFFNGPNGNRNFDMDSGPTSGVAINFAFDYQLNAGETLLAVFTNMTNNQALVSGGNEYTFFTGHLVK